MIKFFYGSSGQTDAEEVLSNVNRYVKLRENEEFVDHSDEELYKYLNDLDEFVEAVNGTYSINPLLSVDSPNKIKVFIKKVIRKLLQWCFSDIVPRQTDFNAKVVQYVNAESFLLRTLSDECISLRAENGDLKLKLKALEQEKEDSNEN